MERQDPLNGDSMTERNGGTEVQIDREADRQVTDKTVNSKRKDGGRDGEKDGETEK